MHVTRNQVVVVAEGRHAVGAAPAAIEQSVLIGVAVKNGLLVTDLIIGAKEPDIGIGPAFERALERLVKVRPAGVDGKQAVLAGALEGAEVLKAILADRPAERNGDGGRE